MEVLALREIAGKGIMEKHKAGYHIVGRGGSYDWSYSTGAFMTRF